jgi:hypothetical protein
MATAPHAHGPRPRILRIGVLLGGKIVEERLIRDRGDVTVGQSSKNTFSVPLEGLPREWTLRSWPSRNSRGSPARWLPRVGSTPRTASQSGRRTTR